MVRILQTAVLLLLVNVELLAQNVNPVAFSGNGKYMADIVKSVNIVNNVRTNREVRVYDLDSNKMILRVPMVGRKKADESLTFNYLGSLLHIRSGYYSYMLDLSRSEFIHSFGGPQYVLFPELEPFFIQDDGAFKAIDTYGKTITYYDKSSRRGNYRRREAQLTYNDQFLVVQDNARRVKVWNTFSDGLIKSYSGNAYYINHITNELTIRNRSKTYTYSLPSFSLAHRIDLKKTIMTYLKNNLDDTRSMKINLNNLTLNPAGTFALVPYSEKDRNNMLVVSIKTGRCEQLSTGNMGGKQEVLWLSDTTLLLKDDINQFNKLTLTPSPSIEKLHYPISDKKNADGKKYDKHKNNLIISTSHNLHAYYSKGLFGSTSTWYNGNINELDDLQPIAFTPDESKLLVRSKEMVLGFIDLNGDLNQVHYLSDSLLDISDLINPLNETPPEGYNYRRFIGQKHLDDLDDSSQVHISIKSIDQSDSTVNIQVHLLDDHGNFYAGGASEKWKEIWCNLVLQQQGNSKRQIVDFEIEEANAVDSIPTAMVFVLDHSGSMGELLAKRLQHATRKYLQNKNAKDIIAIIKYDNHIIIEAPASYDKDELLDKIQVEGLKKFGGSTALLDGINHGISILRKTPEFDQKIVIAITDGYENSSRISLAKVTDKAYNQNVQVHTIGFGYFVDDNFLSAVAYNTGGSYYKIYSQTDFSWIFDDINSKLNSYYNIKFHVGEAGSYKTMLKICLENQSDTAGVSFVKHGAEFSHDSKKRLEQFAKVSNPLPLIKDEKTMEKLKTKDIQDFSQISVHRGISRIDVNVVDTLDYAKIDEEFEAIEFPKFQFKTATDSIVEGDLSELDGVLVFLKKYPTLKIEIGGHTDDVGEHDDNIRLSELRARKIKDILVQKGASTTQIEAKGYGETLPLVKNDSEANRLINRRVSIQIVTE